MKDYTKKDPRKKSEKKVLLGSYALCDTVSKDI